MSRILKGLRFYPACKLMHYPVYSFVCAGRRHETTGSETKDFTTQATAGNMSFMFILISSVSKYHMVMRMWAYIDTAHAVELCYSS